MIERTHLEILRTLEQYGTLTKTAKVMKISQSALSHSIAKLENQLECTLWEKKGRGLMLTPQGQQLLKLSKKTLPLFEKLESELLQSSAYLRSYVRIGMECYPCFQWLSAMLGDFFKAWPNIDIDVKQRFKFGAVGALVNHDIDLIITPDPYFKDSLIYEPVFEYELIAICSQNHHLAQKTSLLPEDFAEERLISYPIPVERLDIFTRFLIPAQVVPHSHKSFETTEMILQMVAAGRGIAVLPDWLIDEYRDKVPLSRIKVGTAGLHKKNYIGYRSSDREFEYIKHFISLAKRFWWDYKKS